MIKRFLTIIFSFIGSLQVFSQNTEIAVQSDSIPLVEAITQIESKTSYHFYFRKEWLDALKVYKGLVKPPYDYGLIGKLLLNTRLTYYVDGNSIILLYNTNVITEPSIAHSLDNQRQDFEEDDVFFENENNKNDVENRLVTIGNRNKYVKGKMSTVAGYVTDIESGEPVEGVFIYLANPMIGTSTDENGFYAISIPNGQHELIVQSVNMIDTKRRLMVFSDGTMDIKLEPDQIALNAIIINAERERNVKDTQMGLAKINYEDIKVVPPLLGERDIVKVATLTAGVQNVGEGSAGINIRGGKADQNLFLLDGTTIFNTNHFFGFFSVFNTDAIASMELYKSAIPAEFGGRLSSVFDIRSKDPKNDKIFLTGGIGPVTSKLMIEGPTFKKGPTFMIGGRATYSDYVLQQLKNSSLKNNNASFYDVITKFEQKINPKNNLTFTGYFSFDRFQMASDTLLSYTDFEYTNRALAINWSHIISDKLQGDFELGTSSYNYGLGYDLLPTKAFNLDFFIKEYKLAEKLDYYVNEKMNFNFGLEAKLNEVNPGDKYPVGEQSLVAPEKIANEKGFEVAPYFSAIYNYSDQLSIDAGLRYSIFSVLGPASVNEYAEGTPLSKEFITGTKEYRDNQLIKTYHGPEFRFSARYSLNDNSSIKASYGRTRQNIHLLINSASIAPTDVWRLSNAYIKPQVADQVSLGYYKNFYAKHTIETSVEAYYKTIKNLLDVKVGSDLQFNPYVETAILQGKGRSYGIELSVKKSRGWLTGWINYTYSRSLIQLNGEFPEEVINGGVFFPTGYDKPHYINSVTNYKFTRRLTMTLNFVYSTGVPVTYPVGKWNFKSSENLFYSERNAFRIPDYFRMDLGINIEGSHKIKKMVHSSWTFSVYNLLGRDNIYSVFFKVEDGVVNGYKLLVFPTPIPTITYNFSF
ncbi:MAG: TonB-dependent receptor [Cyclobacteriaceae bacterium]|nr:TonB-dependent receptor [Cyclobacteriaceae bacterium]